MIKTQYLYTTFFIFSLFISTRLAAQDRPIGDWRSHLPYNKATRVTTDGNKIFVGTSTGFYTYNPLEKETEVFSKVEGMSDADISYVSYDPISQYTVIAYQNSNIDLYNEDGFFNIPDLKIKNITGDKSIYHVYVESGLAYLSSGIGIVVLNLDKKEVKETYTFTKNMAPVSTHGLTGYKNDFYAATTTGLFKTTKTNPNIQATSSWTRIDTSRAYQHICMTNNRLYVATRDSVFAVQADTLNFVYRHNYNKVQHVDAVGELLCISTFNTTSGIGSIVLLDSSYTVKDTFLTADVRNVIRTEDGKVWTADFAWGLRNTSSETIIPNGPFDVGTYDILAQNGKVYIAHGAYDDRWNIQMNPAGISIFENNTWTSYNRYNFPAFNELSDACRLALDPQTEDLYIASQTNGLFVLKKDGTGLNYKAPMFEQHIIDPSTYRLSGVAFDQYNNLWVTQSNSPHELVARAANSDNWYTYGLPATRPRPYWSNGAAGLIVDDYNQKWFFSPAGGGVLVYNDNNTLSNPSDDKYIKLLAGKGSGNLPDNGVQCIVNDKKGVIWIGTNNGIGIINCPDRITNLTCEAEIRVVQYDQFAGELFAGEIVKTIAVDGANRKWVGTNNGVWLISDDANKIIARFTKDNSPLPSNVMQSIGIDPLTGDVYFGTDKGIVAYRGTATDGGKSNVSALIYPNPIRNDYTGTIAIKGLVNNADVRITDVNGQLIFRTKALGGQAIWNGRTYTGQRPQTGVLLVFATDNEGNETFVGKMVFIY